MNKSLAATASLLLAIPALASGATAQSMSRQGLTPQRLQQIQQAQSSIRAGLTVARQGTLQVTATFVRRSAFTQPVRCSADILVIPGAPSSSVQPSELSQSSLVAFNGRTGTCTLSMNYNWPDIDANTVLFISLSVLPDTTTYYRNGSLKRPNANPTTILDSWSFNQPAPLPAGGTTVYDFGKLTL